METREIQLIDLKSGSRISRINDELAMDEPVCIFVNGVYHATLIATPAQRKELAVGYLLTGGIIGSQDDIQSIGFRDNDVLVDLIREVDLREASIGVMNLIVTACGSGIRGASSIKLPKVESRLEVRAEDIVKMCAELNKRSIVHRRTGGTHAAMICSRTGEVQSFAEDVGRHNAVDKVIGSMVLEKRELGRSVLVNTGRLSGEVVQKAARGGVPIVASMTVPLTSGIRLAEATGLTLASLWRGRLKVYSHPERIEQQIAAI